MSEDLTIGNGVELEFPGDPGKLPTSNELPLGVLELKIGVGTPGYTPESSDPGKVGGKARVTIQFIMTDHSNQAAYAGMPASQDFWIGSNDDPKGSKWGTWARNATLLMSLFKEAGVAFAQGTKLREALKAAEGQVVLGDVRKQGGKNQAYADRHTIRKFYKVGSKPVQMVDEGFSSNGHAAPDPALAAAFGGVSTED